MNFTAVDFETANWFRRSACSIGLVVVEDGIIVEKFHTLIKPEPFWFHDRNISIHGITENDCLNAPSFIDLWPEIRDRIENRIIVAHNAPFEKSVFNHLFDHYNIDGYIEDYLCTLYMSRVHYNQLHSYKLPIVYKQAFNKELNHHDALKDAIASAEIAIEITRNWNPPSFEKMVEAIYEEKKIIRNARKPKITFSKITPDTGFEDITTLRGKQFVFTGTLAIFSKQEAAQLMVNFGATAGDNLTKSTTHLVVADNNNKPDNSPTGKLKKAITYKEQGQNITILTEQEFYNLVNTLKR